MKLPTGFLYMPSSFTFITPQIIFTLDLRFLSGVGV